MVPAIEFYTTSYGSPVGSIRLIRVASAELTGSLPLYRRRTLAGFFRRRWLRWPFILTSLPLPVIRNLAAAPLWVLSFGTL